jgi:hypothetical protein
MAVAQSALERAHHLLQQDMYLYLDTLEMLTDESNVDDEDILAIAREHLPHLIDAVRGALGKHQADTFGHCLGCPPAWTNGQYTRTVWPCAVVDQIHGYMLKPETIYRKRATRESTSPGS